jgi:predicted RNA-binding protein (TIGR00451 family)
VKESSTAAVPHFNSRIGNWMFKKDRDLTERSKSLLKNKEVRVLKADVSSTFNISEDDLNQLLPAKGSVSISKLCSKILIYSVNSVPLFFSIKNDILPTLYSLWKYPEMARCILIPGPVSQFIMNGADLMLPGVAAISNLEGLKKGDVVCIKIIGNPLPLAVGYSDIDGDQITSNGNKGKCVVVVHCFGDMLWQSGGAISPNKGFSTNCRHISPIQSYDMDDTMENLDIHPDGNDSLSQLKNDVIDEASHEGTIKESVNIIESDVRHVIEDSVGFTSESISNIDIIDIVVSTSNTISDCGDATATQDEIMKAEDAHHDVDVQSFNQTVDAIAIQRSSADSLLLVCLLRCLKYGVRDKDLPILASKFWSILLRLVVVVVFLRCPT